MGLTTEESMVKKFIFETMVKLIVSMNFRCELRDPSGGCVSDVSWNPDQGLHLVTASGEDKNPVLKLWDLRSSTSLPLATLQGHTEGSFR